MLASLPTVFEPLRYRTAVHHTAKLANAFVSSLCDDTLLDFFAQPKVGLDSALNRDVPVRERLENYPKVDWPVRHDREEE